MKQWHRVWSTFAVKKLINVLKQIKNEYIEYLILKRYLNVVRCILIKTSYVECLQKWFDHDNNI